MRYLINKCFQRDLRANGLDVEYVNRVLDDISLGRASSLGSKMYKIRAAKAGQGKRGGYRNIFFWRRDELLVFCLLFTKNEQDNLTDDEKKALKILSNEYDQLTGAEIDAAIQIRYFKEIEYDRST